jgi:hypothetical protein
MPRPGGTGERWLRGLAATFTEHEPNGDHHFERTLQRPTRWAEPAKSPSHGENRGSSPLGSANDIKEFGCERRLVSNNCPINVHGQARTTAAATLSSPQIGRQAFTAACATPPDLPVLAVARKEHSSPVPGPLRQPDPRRVGGSNPSRARHIKQPSKSARRGKGRCGLLRSTSIQYPAEWLVRGFSWEELLN